MTCQMQTRPASWVDLMGARGSVLAVVNTRKVAWEVYRCTVDLLREQGMRPVAIDCALDRASVMEQARTAGKDAVLCIHLSTLLCPKHRLAYIDFAKAWLEGGGRALCVSTALIEAGINISFPVVVRSLAGMPSIVQAGGRCNRNMERESGDVYIWEFKDEILEKLPEIANGKRYTNQAITKIRTILRRCASRAAFADISASSKGMPKVEKYPIDTDQRKSRRPAQQTKRFRRAQRLHFR